MAHWLLIDDDPALTPEPVRQAFSAPRYRIEVAGTGANRLGHGGCRPSGASGTGPGRGRTVSVLTPRA